MSGRIIEANLKPRIKRLSEMTFILIIFYWFSISEKLL